MGKSKPFERPPPAAMESRTAWLWKDGLFRVRFKEGADVDVHDARENVRMGHAVVLGQRTPGLVDLRWLRSQTSAARDVFSSSEGIALSGAIALFVDSPLSRAIGNFYLGFNRPNVPTKIFTDEASAREWLLTHMPKAA